MLTGSIIPGPTSTRCRSGSQCPGSSPDWPSRPWWPWGPRVPPAWTPTAALQQQLLWTASSWIMGSWSRPRSWPWAWSRARPCIRQHALPATSGLVSSPTGLPAWPWGPWAVESQLPVSPQHAQRANATQPGSEPEVASDSGWHAWGGSEARAKWASCWAQASGSRSTWSASAAD